MRDLRLYRAARIVAEGCGEPLAHYDFLLAHWRNLRTTNPLERLNRDIRRRTRVVESFPDVHAALMLVRARLRYMAGQKWGTQRYLNMRTEGYPRHVPCSATSATCCSQGREGEVELT